MKIIGNVCLFLLFGTTVFGQIKPIEKKNCYDRSAARKGQRFVEWECGKTSGVIDCNDKLEVDEGSNTIFSKGSGEPFTGTCETCHMNGIRERKVTFVEGKESGIDTAYYESGCPMVTRNHIQGVQNGQWTYYYDSTSNLAWEMNYFAGLKHGRHIFFTKKGDTTLWENYKNGLLEGKKIKYYPKSKREREVSYQKGLMHGQFISYNRDGVIIEKINYKEGKREGESVYFYDDGKLLRTENWTMDCKNGEVKTFYYDQSLQTLESYKKGSGKTQEYFSFDVYECPTMDAAKQVAKLLEQKKSRDKIIEEMSATATLTVYEDHMIEQSDKPYLKGQKLIRGVNEPYKHKEKFYTVLGLDRQVIAKKELREGPFEEYYPDKKPKRLAVYKNDVLIEEHVFDEQGNETKTFGGKAGEKTEDDQVPGGKKGKKKGK